MKIAIAGYGVEGVSNYDYFSKWPDADITIVDESQTPSQPLPEGVATILGADAFQKLDGFDMVIRTAGLAPYKLKTDGKVWSATNEFFEKCPAPIIGITGSKGKGTTSSLIASILEAAGRKVWLVGNIGIASLDVLDQISPDDIVVYELSSFQLWDVERSPHTAVVLLIERDHLDVHRSMEEYVEAKGNIARFQTADDLVIFNGQNLYATQIGNYSPGTKIAFPEEASAHATEGEFWYGEHKICSTDVLQLRGPHNVSNAIAAIDAVWNYTQDPVAIEKGLASFKGLPHRLAFVKTVNGIDFYDDSIATTPGSAIAALRAFTQPKVIILGGSSKDSDFIDLADEMTRHDVQAVLVGQEAPRIAAALKSVGFTRFEILEDTNAVEFTKRAYALAQPGSVVLLSPSAASFGMFKNYADRGEQFIAAVNEL
jgi:UDP-N-acetylmuramoylalanine--D-glutamate ligase